MNSFESFFAVEYLSPQMEQELEELLREDAPTDVGKIANILAEMKRLQSLHQGGGEEYVNLGGSASGYQTSSEVYQPNGSLYDQNMSGGSLHY